MEPGTVLCPICRQMVPSANAQLHELHCARSAREGSNRSGQQTRSDRSDQQICGDDDSEWSYSSDERGSACGEDLPVRRRSLLQEHWDAVATSDRKFAESIVRGEAEEAHELDEALAEFLSGVEQDERDAAARDSQLAMELLASEQQSIDEEVARRLSLMQLAAGEGQLEEGNASGVEFLDGGSTPRYSLATSGCEIATRSTPHALPSRLGAAGAAILSSAPRVQHSNQAGSSQHLAQAATTEDGVLAMALALSESDSGDALARALALSQHDF